MSNDLIEIVLIGIWLTIPAYVANPSAVLFGGGRPMDFEKRLKGERILGDGKTWRGFFGGVFSGILIGVIQIAISSPIDEGHLGFGGYPDFLAVIILLSFGSLMGDVMGSFVKRRLGIKRGQKAPFLDQYDFLIGAWLLLLIFKWQWFFEHFVYWPNTLALITVIILTPFLHKGVNVLGYKMGKKDVPW
ncbi:MAG: CDP-2,3-bis-(O-geranylgeranyl)-sn-glycerol synthase [Methanomassiliicoccales archaeon]|nr:MAG: CDP-2,3-bis-(O-geranylgeranyl)-sn-glycerol synthase [Methanomassiliicoccales archaeon]